MSAEETITATVTRFDFATPSSWPERDTPVLIWVQQRCYWQTGEWTGDGHDLWWCDVYGDIDEDLIADEDPVIWWMPAPPAPPGGVQS